jgi:hypothetical protein
MALEIAQDLLLSGDPMSELSQEFLDSALRRGVEVYRSILTSSMEHTSAEETWTLFPHLKLQGEIVQGVLSHDPSHPQGLGQLLRGLSVGHQASIPSIAEEGRDWVYVVLIKSPETILLCLSAHEYVLVDSHPRPHLWPDAIHAYAKRHRTLEGLVESVQTVFPIVDLGPDVPELMSIMYNSFDLYFFIKKQV